jgi:porphobilinogen synthase
MTTPFPLSRPRRLRRDDFTRRLVREHALSVNDLIYPVFVLEGEKRRNPVASMPGVDRVSLDLLLHVAEDAAQPGIPVMASFATSGHLKTPDGKEATNPKGLVPDVVSTLKNTSPIWASRPTLRSTLTPATAKMDCWTTRATSVNDVTVEVLKQQALTQAHAGVEHRGSLATVMDGRIGAIRHAREEHGHIHTRIMAYSAKYASAFYGPFRDAVGSAANLGKSDKKTYQMDPGNTDEALREVALDIAEGADMVMVKPGMP